MANSSSMMRHLLLAARLCGDGPHDRGRLSTGRLDHVGVGGVERLLAFFGSESTVPGFQPANLFAHSSEPFTGFLHRIFGSAFERPKACEHLWHTVAFLHLSVAFRFPQIPLPLNEFNSICHDESEKLIAGIDLSDSS